MRIERARAARRARRGGFTLVEIMVVVVIIGLLATMVGPSVFNALFRSNIQVAKSDISSIAEAVRMYRLDNSGRLPESLEELVTPNEQGTVYLRDQVEVPKDPWENEYVLEPDPDRPQEFIVRSFGPDGEQGTEDDITNLTMRQSRDSRGR